MTYRIVTRTHPILGGGCLSDGKRSLQQTTLEGDCLRIWGHKDCAYGVLFRPLQILPADYKRFQNLTAFLEDYPGIEIDNSIGTYPKYLREGLVKYSDKTILRINHKSTRFTPYGYDDYARDKSLPLGIATIVAGITAGACVLNQVGLPAPLAFLMSTTPELLIGIYLGEKRESKYWLGPLRCLGHLPYKQYYSRKFSHPSWLWEKAVGIALKAENSTNYGECQSLRNRLCPLIPLLEGQFHQTQDYQGLTIHYKGTLDEVLGFFSYLKTGNQKHLIQPEDSGQPLPLINPWEVDIPEIKSLLQGVKG